MYNKYKTSFYKDILKTVSNNYKKTLLQHYNRFNNDKINKLRAVKRNNLREYWKIINSQKKSEDIGASVQAFYDHFTNMNKTNNDNNNYIDVNDDTETNDNAGNELNQTITASEILSNIKSLNNNKAAGIDSIVNEHIKSTAEIMLPVYTKLFNLIFDSGVIPESWTVGIIKPIYKNKGDCKLPENYRPITLLSCFGKLFTSIINNRLQKYAERYNIINWTQAGFRKGYSTSDNLFLIKSLIDILQSQKKKLYCCFIGFKQAFDNVWRVGLWHKLIQDSVRGKCFNLIKNLYKTVKSKVSTPDGSSEFLSATMGLDKGKTYHPFYFQSS